MLFNPLFIQLTGQTDASSAVKQTKLNSPTYLFSDIIKLIHENTIGDVSANSPLSGVVSADTNIADRNSTESLTQLLSMAGNNSDMDNVDVSLNNLLKNLLISTNSDQVNANAAKTDAKNTEPVKTTSAVSNSDLKKIFKSLAACLQQLNLSPEAIQQIKTAGADLNSVTQTEGVQLNAPAGLTITNNGIPQLVINLNQNLNPSVIPQKNNSSQPVTVKSILDAITAIVTKPVNKKPSKDSKKTAVENTAASSSATTTAVNIEQLAAALMNLYKNNSGLVLKVNSGETSLNIEIAGDLKNSAQSIQSNSGANINSQNQVDNTLQANQVTVPTTNSDKAQQTDNTNNNASIASGQANEIIKTAAEVTAPLVVSTQGSPKIAASKNITVVPAGKDDVIPVKNEVKSSGPVKESANNVVPSALPEVKSVNKLSTEDKVIITVISNLNNTKVSGIQGITPVKSESDTIPAAQEFETVPANNQNAVSDVKNIPANQKVSNDVTGIKSDDKISLPANFEKITTIKEDVKAPFKVEESSVNNTKISDSDKTKPADNTEEVIPDVKPAEIHTENLKTKEASAQTLKSATRNTANIKSEEVVYDNPDKTKDVIINNNLKDNVKAQDDSGVQRTNPVAQNSIANTQSVNSSNDINSNTTSFKPAGAEEVAQVVNNKQGNSFSDQQQKKSSDSNKNSETKPVQQFSTDFTAKSAELTKDKFMNQTALKDIPEKTIRITEITKEITDIIQQNSSKSVVLQLKPESLGKIKVIVDVNNNAVNARVEVDTEAVKQIVQNNTTELRQSLNFNGMQLSSISVNVSGGEQKPFQPHSQKKKHGYHSSDKRIDDNVSLASAKSMGYNTYEYLI